MKILLWESASLFQGMKNSKKGVPVAWYLELRLRYILLQAVTLTDSRLQPKKKGLEKEES